MDSNNFNFIFSLQDNQILIDKQNVEQFKKEYLSTNNSNYNNSDTNSDSNKNNIYMNYKNNDKKNNSKNRKLTKKLSIFNIKKKQKKSKAQQLIKQGKTNARYQKEEDLN